MRRPAAARTAVLAAEEQRGEAGEGHAIDIPKIGRAQMTLKLVPTECAQSVAAVDAHDGERQVNKVCAADGFPKLGAAELAEMESAAEMIEQVSDHKDTESGSQCFPRLQRHEEAEYGGAGGGVKRG